LSRLTVIISARNEELHVRRCVESARELGPVVVVDSGSEDRTMELARSAGASVVEHPWEGYAAQKNWALDNLPRSEWVLFLDADERLTEEGRAEIAAATAHARRAGYYVARRYVFLGRELKHAWWYPDYQLRLFRWDRGRYEQRRVHEHVVVDGEVGTLQVALIHENEKGLFAFIERHNRYSELEVEELLAPSPERKRGSLRRRDGRRRLIKERIWMRMPFRPTLRFVWLYVVKLGFLDGRQGLLFCRLIATYELLIDAKVLERRLLARAPGEQVARLEKLD
jgi:glycosyltransferase involved in cell wall biosynthesis